MPHRAPGSPQRPSTSSGRRELVERRGPRQYLTGKPITYYRPKGDPGVRALIDQGFQAFNAGRLSEACHIVLPGRLRAALVSI